MARHYYDVWCLITRGVAERAAQDRPLFDRVAAHREIFFRWSWVDYTTLHPGALRFVPPANHLDAWRKAYEEMRGEMFFGEVPKRAPQGQIGLTREGLQKFVTNG